MNLSIIIPAYNAEKTIADCLDSLEIQRTTIYDFEVIVVDDGSTDATLSVLNQLQSKFDWLKVIHQSNSKQATARNTGMLYASGDYYCFIDADDKIAVNYVEKMLNLAFSNNYQLVVCGIQKVWNDDASNKVVESKSIFSEALTKTKKKMIGDLLNNNNEADVGLWNKIYSSKVIEDNKIQFKNENFFEDSLFNLEFLIAANLSLIITTEEVLYTLNKRDNLSTTTSYSSKMDFLTNQFIKFANKALSDNFSEISWRNKVMKSLIVRLTIHQINYHLTTDEHWTTKDTRFIVKSNIQFYLIFSYYDLPRKYKISCLILKIIPRLYERMYTINSRGSK